MDVVRVSVRELLHHSREVLARVEQGDRLQITRRGRVVAVLAPPAPDEVAMDQLVAAGEIDPDWTDRQAELRRTLDRLPARSAAPGSSAGTDALIANRDER